MSQPASCNAASISKIWDPGITWETFLLGINAPSSNLLSLFFLLPGDEDSPSPHSPPAPSLSNPRIYSNQHQDLQKDRRIIITIKEHTHGSKAGKYRSGSQGDPEATIPESPEASGHKSVKEYIDHDCQYGSLQETVLKNENRSFKALHGKNYVKN